MHRSARVLAPLAALALFATSCGEPPRRAPSASGSSGGGSPHASSDAGTTGAAGTATVAAEPIRFAGVVRLGGAAATPPAEAVVFVSLKPRGGMMPILSRRIELSDAAQEEGALVLPFELDGTDAMMTTDTLDTAGLAQLSDAQAFDLEVIYDPTGGLTDKTVQLRQRVEVDAFDIDDVVFEVGG